MADGKSWKRDWDVARQYKRECDRWDIRIPSIAGIWDKGVISSPNAVQNLRLSLRAAEILGSSVVLVAFFKDEAGAKRTSSSCFHAAF
jgi:hypothetical protein